MNREEIKCYADLIRATSEERAKAFNQKRDAAKSAADRKRDELVARMRPLLDVLQSVKNDPTFADKVYVFHEDGPSINTDGSVGRWPEIVSRGAYTQRTDPVTICIDGYGRVALFQPSSQLLRDEGKILFSADDAHDLVPNLIVLIADMTRQREIL